MNKLRIMYISNEAGLGGAMQSLVDMLVSLKDYVYPVVILPSEGTAESLLEERKILYYVVPFKMAYGKIGKGTQDIADRIFFDNYQAALEIAKITDEKNIQLIHSNSIVVNVGAMVSVMKNIPHIWHIREFLEEDFASELYDKEWSCQLFEEAAGFISISKCVQKSYLQKYGIHSIQLYNCLDAGRYKWNADMLFQKEYTFLLAGHMHTGKGQWDAIKAIEVLLKNNLKNIHLNIVGNGSKRYVWCIEKYIKEKKLEKYISVIPAQKDLTVLRKKSCFSLTTSKMEALGRVTIEAMLAGNLVIGADTGGTEEIIGASEQYGYLYRQGDFMDLARVMGMAIRENMEKRNALRKSAYEFAIDRFALETYSEKILDVYRNSLSGKKAHESEECQDAMKNRYQKLLCESKYNWDIVSQTQTNKWRQQFILFEKWMSLKRKGNKIEEFFVKEGIKNIAIYGMGYMGCNLYDELENTGINISYIIDRDINDIKDVTCAVLPNGLLNKVDAIVITVFNEENEIKLYLEKKCSYKIFLLSQIINWLETTMFTVQTSLGDC